MFVHNLLYLLFSKWWFYSITLDLNNSHFWFFFHTSSLLHFFFKKVILKLKGVNPSERFGSVWLLWDRLTTLTKMWVSLVRVMHVNKCRYFAWFLNKVNLCNLKILITLQFHWIYLNYLLEIYHEYMHVCKCTFEPRS